MICSLCRTEETLLLDYTVHSSVWKRAGYKKETLCLRCLLAALEGSLDVADFPCNPCNAMMLIRLAYARDWDLVPFADRRRMETETYSAAGYMTESIIRQKRLIQALAVLAKRSKK